MLKNKNKNKQKIQGGKKKESQEVLLAKEMLKLEVLFRNSTGNSRKENVKVEVKPENSSTPCKAGGALHCP